MSEKSNNERAVLKTNNKIELLNMSSGGNEIFTIKTIVGLGGSSVCYRAVRGNVKGLLKEFYPCDFNNNRNFLKRNKNNQLVAWGNLYCRQFKEMCDDFCESIHLLSKVNFNKESNVLNNYIPSYEIFKGTDKNSTVYVWCKENLGDTFSEYIKYVRNSPDKNQGFKLYNILTTIKTISVSVVAMHKNGLLHRDIKPENFLLFKDGMGNVNPNNISVFDINSFSYGSRSKFIVGTEGYKAPEVSKGKANYYSDIYSIGAMIFYALVGKLYRDEYYEEIGNYIEESVLMKTADVYLKTRIINILKKTLAKKPDMRYETTEALVEALDKAIVRLLPETYSEMLDSNQTLKIIENKKPIDAIPIFQDLLYKRPVYKWFEKEAKDINILVLGGGVYAQAFCDVALQTLQIKDKNLNLTVVSDSSEYDKQIYLKYRPDMVRFFDIDKKGRDDTSYGKIKFAEAKFNKSREEDKQLIEKIVEKTNPCYILISLGDDELNHEIAKIIVDAKIKAAVNFVWSDNEERKFSKGTPVYINSKTEYKKIDENLLKMAFNTHLMWNDSVDADIDMLYSDFRKIYNYKASIAFALSIPYKLYSMNLTMNEVTDNPDKIYFKDDSEEKTELLKELSWMEHRRWVAEKITAGWTAPIDENGKVVSEKCLEFNGNKSSKEKLHLCIAKSTSELDKLPEEKLWWDTCDTGTLDDLDRVSVEVYRCFAKKAEELKNEYFIKNSELIKSIRKWIPGDDAGLIKLFNDYEHSVKTIVFENNSLYASGFSGLHKRLVREIEKKSVLHKNRVLNILDEVYEKIQPGIHKSKRTDYKVLDEKLVMNMLNILKNKPHPKLSVVFNDGINGEFSNNDRFGNVASAAALIARKIKYLYYFDEYTDETRLLDGIRGVMAYFENKQMKCKPEFIFVSEKKVRNTFKTNLQSIFQGKVKYYEDRNTDEAIKIFYREASECDFHDIGNMPFCDDIQNSKFIKDMSRINCFEFDSKENRLKNVGENECVKYINTPKTKLMVSDIFALKNKTCESCTPDFFEFYRDIWGICSGDCKKGWSGVFEKWGSLCKKLRYCAKEQDVLVKIKNSKEKSKLKSLSKIIPGDCFENAKKIIDELEKLSFIKEGEAYILNSDGAKIKITYAEEEIEKLFTMYNALQGKINIKAFPEKNEIVISKNNLRVDGVVLTKEEIGYVEKLAEYGILNDLFYDKKTKNEYIAEFSYATGSIKEVLTNPEEILKLHVYYSAVNCGCFDDVEMDVLAGDSRVDLIVTKDNKCIFTDCGLNEDNSEKNNENAEKYGINCSVVRIADLYNKGDLKNISDILLDIVRK